MRNVDKWEEKKFDSKGKELDCHCLRCGHTLDAASGLGHINRPTPGDFSICIKCEALAVYDNHMKLREPTTDERFQFISENPGLIERVRAARRMVEATEKSRTVREDLKL